MISEVDQLVVKLSELEKNANELRRKRDKLNTEAREKADRRDELNKQMAELINQVKEHQKQRDVENTQVKEFKVKREEVRKKLAEAKDIELNKLVEELKDQLKNNETVKSFKSDEDKLTVAYGFIYRKYCRANNEKECIIKLLSLPRSKIVKIDNEEVYVTDIACLASTEDSDDIIYCAGTLWRDAGKNARNLTKDKVYKTKLIFSKKDFGAQITGNNTTFSSVNSDPFPSIEDYYKENIKGRDIYINEFDSNIAMHDVDIRVIDGKVADLRVGKGKNGAEYGVYLVMDETIRGETISIFLEPEEIKYFIGSLIKFGGVIRKKKNNNTVWINHFLIPINPLTTSDAIMRRTRERSNGGN